MILFPDSRLFDTGFIVIPKRMYSSRIYEGYHTLVTYPITFLKEKEIAGYLFSLLYMDGEGRRCCHFSSQHCWNMNPDDMVEFISSFSEDADAVTVVETYAPPPTRTQKVFPYSELLCALPGNIDLSSPLKRAGFTEVMRIPCFELQFLESAEPITLNPFQGTHKEYKFYWNEWVKRPEALSIEGRSLKNSIFIDNYLYDFPLFSSPDMVLFGEQGVVHWFPDVEYYLENLEVFHKSMADLHVKRVKLFRVAGNNSVLESLLEQSMQYIFSKYTIKRFQLDNLAAKSIVKSLKKRGISNYQLLYERIIFSSRV